MSLILNIDTATEKGSLCLAENDQSIATDLNNNQMDHASWLQPALRNMMDRQERSLSELSAIAVTQGPGSYTGLRIGMASAKGLCYALQIPLIVISTLKAMASAAVGQKPKCLLAPMIDARRMEVFAAVYNQQLEEIMQPVNLILNEESFQELLNEHSVCFFGSGSGKFQRISHSDNAFFAYINHSASSMVAISYEKWLRREFADLAYSEPFYGKAFYTPKPPTL